MILYTVKEGDSLYEIAKTYHTTVNEIVSANGLQVSHTLIIGQGLVIPSEQTVHVVTKGESLYSISQKYGVTVSSILDANPYIQKPFVIYPGQQVMITNDMDRKRPMTVNGYIFPKTNEDEYLPNGDALTFASIFAYHIRDDGSIIPIQDEATIARLNRNEIAPILTVTNTDEKGSFSTSLASFVLRSSDARKKLVDEIYQTIVNKKYYGVNIDFEYVSPDDKDNYITFLLELRDKLSYDYEFSVAVAPKYSKNQEGLLYEAHDYKRIGEIVDRVIIMTYEWGYTYGPAMAVAPLHLVRKVVEYAIQEINPEKINLGIPTYGYDFTLPFKKGQKAKSLSYEDALALAYKEKAKIYFEENSETPYFVYYKENKKHIVYYEDGRSIAKKIDLALRYHLGGVSFWTLRSPFQQLWSLVNEAIDVVKYN